MSLWVPFLALAWLLPNHYNPWATFHTDAWVALAMVIACGTVLVRSVTRVAWHGISLVIGLLVAIPFLQFKFGMIPFSGQAWLYSAYIIGLLLALLIGAQWEAATPGQAADALFFSLLIASLVSVALQLRQWLGLGFEAGELNIWTAEFTPGRPSANLGQPNQLADILLWGLLGCGWITLKKYARPIFGVLAALLILFGLALTQSRAGALGLVAITFGAWWWRHLLPSRTPQVTTLLFTFYITCSIFLQNLSELFGLDLLIRTPTLGGASSQLRLKAYELFIDAIAHRPIWGYGWDQLAVAQLEVAQDHGSLTSFFLHSHNLFLDLILWCGLPIGGAVSLYLIGWTIARIRQTSSEEDVLLVLFIVVIALHAMVELPLHHAYLLLPTGLVMGILNQSQEVKVICKSNRWNIFILMLGSFVLLCAIVVDYFKVDESFRHYKLDAAHIGNLPPGSPPDVVVLNQLREFIIAARAEFPHEINESDLPKLYKVTMSFPTPANLFNYAKALALLHRPVEAGNWLVKIQRVQPAEFNPDMRRIWFAQTKNNPAMAVVIWPDEDMTRPSTMYVHQ